MVKRKKEESKEIMFKCCFCGKESGEPAMIIFETEKEGTQYFFCHPVCFIKRMCKAVKCELMPSLRKYLKKEEK